ncbi:MAG: hypothetical protein UFG06_14025 [Lachnospiraceae bacterium]|nr:hypothetical protein [Lachnospiraceae bacterium]
MAIIFSKNSGLNDDFWKVEAQVLQAVMNDTDNEKNDYDEFVKAVFNEKTSKKYAEKLGSLTSLGNFNIVGEGEKAPMDDIKEGFSKLIEHKTFSKSFACTREMKDDGDIDVMKTMSANFVRAYKRTRAQYASDALTTEAATFTFSGKAQDKTTGDGKALFATDHPGKKDGVAVQSNVYTNAFGTDATMLNRLANIGKNFKNQSGNIQGYTFDTIVIPSNVPALEDLIKRIIRSELIVGSSNNDVNTQKGLWNLVVDPMWQVTSGAPYILMSSQANKEIRGSMFYDRVPLDVKNQVDLHTRNLEWNGYGRMSAGFNDWRHVILGGASEGTTLT